MIPKVTVLILSYNGKALLQDSISSYINNDYPSMEVVVVDNGSTDGTAEWVNENFPQVYVHRTEQNLKYSGGLNYGMEYAFVQQKADYVLITNNDVVADEKLVSSLVSTAEKSNDTAFTIGKVYYFDAPNIFQTVGKRHNPVLWNGGHIGNKEEDKGQYENEEERAWCDDIYWLVKKEVWRETGGYDTEFSFQGEDFDWQVRAKQLGYKIMYTPKAKLWHKESMTIGKTSAFKAYYDARNPLIIHMKYRNRKEYMPIVKKRCSENLRTTFKYLLKGRLKHFIKIWQGFLSAILWGIKNKRLP